MRLVKRGWIALLILLSLAVELQAEGRTPFTVVVLPDTQFYSESYPETYKRQTLWIKSHAEKENIKFVIHVGDIVQNYNDIETEWEAADAAQSLLDGAVPYSVVPGNHDMGKEGKRLTRDTSFYNKYFPPSRFEQYPWYGGHRGETNDNNYCLFEAAGMKFMVLSLEFSPTDETLDWANGVVAEHPDNRVIVATHCYMRPNGRDSVNNKFQGLPGNSGDEIYDKLVRRHENIFLVASGHVTGVGRQTSLNDAGRAVHETLVDYQHLPNGGDGWLRTMRFVPEEDRIDVRAYSPALEQYNDGPEHTFSLLYDMTLVAEPPIEDPSPERFAKQIDVFAQQDAEQMPAEGVIVFTGSSSIRRWDLPASFGDLDAINRGFGGSHISDVIHYADRVVLKYRPRTVVFFCGGNDLAGDKTPEQVAGDFREFTKLLFDELPKTRLIVFPGKPSTKRWEIVDRVRKLNDLLWTEARADDRITLLDGAFDLMLDDQGAVREDLFVEDGLHLNEEGYKLWTGLVKPLLTAPVPESK